MHGAEYIIVLCSGEVRGRVSHPDLSHAEQTLRAVQYSFSSLKYFSVMFFHCGTLSTLAQNCGENLYWFKH